MATVVANSQHTIAIIARHRAAQPGTAPGTGSTHALATLDPSTASTTAHEAFECRANAAQTGS
jgi:hypothetical protein